MPSPSAPWRSVILGLVLALPLAAQPPDPTDVLEFTFSPEGLSLEDAVTWASETTGIPFHFKDVEFKGKPRIKMTAKIVVPKPQVYEFWQAIFVTQGFAMLPLGDDNKGFFISIEPIEGSRNIKQRAAYVPLEEVEGVRHKVGEVIMTTIPLVHVEVGDVRNAIQLIFTQRQSEFAQEVPGANAIIVVGFAPTVWALYQILKAMDVPPASATLKFETIKLKHAVAEELEPIISQLISGTAGSGASNSAQQAFTIRNPGVPNGGGDALRPGQEVPEPKLIADTRTNALVVYAIERDMNEIKRLVAALDTEVTEVEGDIRVYFLKNTNAQDISETLRDLLGQSQTRTARGVGGTGNAQANTVGQRAQEVVIVPDTNTNSLLIQATKTRYDELRPLIEELDRRRPQVLVHAVIAELSDSDLRNIAVELTAIEGGDDRYRFGGATGFGLSTITAAGAASTGTTTGTGGTGNGAGGGTGGGTTTTGTTTGSFLEDLARIPFATDTGIGFSGLAAGIFERNLNVPLLVSMLQTYTKVNLLSNASVLTNDNEQSTITVGRTLNILQSETTNAGTDRTTATSEVDANLVLSISPHISADDYLRIDVTFTVEAFQGAVDVFSGVPPPRTKREFQGSVTVPNGKTVVIGGLVQDNVAETVTQVPFLGDIPILGELFKSRNNDVQKTTLYLFITPTIIKDFQQLEDISYERKLEIMKLEGNINLIDPNFRALSLEDQELDIDAIERSGMLDLPQYSPVTSVGQTVIPREPQGNPLRPGTHSAGAVEIREGGTVRFMGGEAVGPGTIPDKK